MSYYNNMRSHKLSVIIFSLIIVIVYFFWPDYEPKLPTNGTTVVVFGDSLAEGVGASTGNDIASQLTKSLGQEIINLGVSGDTTADGLARIDALLATNPQVVIVLLGGNDALQKVPVAQTFTNLAEIIERIQTYGAAVILVGEPGGLYGNQYKDEYERLAKKYRTFYVPNILSGLIGHTEYMSDYIHPNDAGYTKAAGRILPILQEALRGKQ